MAKAWCLLPLLLLLGVVRQRGHPGVLCDSGETGLTLQRWTAAMHKKSPAATQSQDTPAQPVKADRLMGDAEVGEEEGGGEEEEDEEEPVSAEKETKERTNSEIESPQENEDGPKDGATETVSVTAPAATSRMLLVEEEDHLPASDDNVTNTRDLLTWRLKDTSLLDELTNRILGSSEDLGVDGPAKGESAKGRATPDGELIEEKGTGGSGGGQSEAASKVVETRVAAPAQYVDQPDRPDCDPQKSLTCPSTDENLELRQQLLQDLQTSFNAPLPSRIRYRLKKKPSIYAIYTSKKPSTRLDIGIPDIYETEVMVTPKHRRQPFSRKPGLRNPEEVYGFAADRKFQQYVLPKSPKYVAIEALATPAYPDATKDAVTKPFIPLDRNRDAEQSGLVFRPPRRPPGSQKRRTNGLLRRPTTGEPHYFTPAPERLSIQAHLQYRRPVSFRYSRTKASPRDDDPALSTTPIQPHPSVSVTSPRPKAAAVATSLHRHQGSSPGSAEGYSTKAAGYSEPSDHYLSPDKEYEAPATTQQPKADYKPPAEDYTEAPEKYLPHSEEYTAPDAPSQPPRKYLPPNKDYEAPESQYQSAANPHADPPQEYLTPNKEYESSEGEGEHQAKPYNEPKRTYIPPNREYEAPKNGHKAPSQAYKQPPRHYLPPNREYMAPPKRPLPLAMGHMAPVMGFVQPPRTYVPPDKEFGSHRKIPGSRRPPHRRRRPSKRRRKNKKRPTPPSRHYIPPNKEYAGAKPDAKPHPGTPPSRTYLAPDKGAPHLPAPPHATKVPLEYNTPPLRTYEPPNKEYIPPNKDASFGHSDSLTMTTMASVLLTSPARKYIPPDRHYQTPSLALGQANSAHGAPTRKYEPPTKEYIPPKTGPHGTALPSWLMSIKQGHAPPGLEDKVKGYTTNPTPPPGYHPDHSQRKNHLPSTKPAAGYEEPPQRETVYQLPGATYHPPEPTYHPPPTVYHPPDPAYHPPERRPSHPGGPTPSPDYSTPARTYELPVREYIPPDEHYLPVTPRPVSASGAYVPPGPPVRDYKLPTTSLPYVPPPPPPIHLPIDPNYLPPLSVTYLPPVRNYQAPASYAGGTTASYGPKTAAPAHPSLPPGYVPPSGPGADYVPPIHPQPDYVPPVTPKPRFTTIVITPLSTPAPEYVPPPSPRPDYVPPAAPKPDYVPPSSPKPDYVPPAAPKPDYVPPSSPKPDYVPPASPKPDYVPPDSPKPDYVPPASPKPDYVPPTSPKPDYVPPETSTAGAPHHPPAPPPPPPPGYHATTYRPVLDDSLQKLQDFSYPGSGLVSHQPARPSPSPRHNATTTTYAPPVQDPTTYAPPVYTPTTYGPGYNDLPASVRPPVHPPKYLPSLYYDDDYDDDYYYYYYYDDDYDYYDDDDYYYYYYDDDYDYDYGPYHAPLRRPVPYHRAPQVDYQIDDNEILDFGYIAGIPGRAGRDYPILSYIPLTSFGCDLVADYPGYYADMEAGCQVFHICHRNGRQDSFLCPNGTIFNQKYFVCDWWYNFACEDAPFFYPVNAAIGHPGVPLHKSAFEPDLHAVHHLPPRHPPQTRHQRHSRHRATRAPGHNFATPLPTHHATAPSPTHHQTAATPLRHAPKQRVTIVPRLGHLPKPGHTSSQG